MSIYRENKRLRLELEDKKIQCKEERKLRLMRINKE